jgi:integrase
MPSPDGRLSRRAPQRKLAERCISSAYAVPARHSHPLARRCPEWIHDCAAFAAARSPLCAGVQERLGHSSIAITMDIHSHLMPNMQGEAAAAVDVALRAAINKPKDFG